ncbi:MAG: DUF3499 family protein [Acidimicrobiales bacterium]
MGLRCARLSCGIEAVASMQFKNDIAEVHIIDLAEAVAGIPLCADHAETRTAPVGWTLVDKRTPTQADIWATEAPAPADAAPQGRPSRRRAADRSGFEFGRVAEPASADAHLDAESPLLSRAFRVVPH